MNYKEDLFIPGYFELSAKKGDVIIFSAGTVKTNPEQLKRKYTLELGKRIPRDSFKHCLINSAQQFFIKRNKKTEIIAGFPWFGCWGRDTFIALAGPYTGHWRHCHLQGCTGHTGCQIKKRTVPQYGQLKTVLLLIRWMLRCGFSGHFSNIPKLLNPIQPSGDLTAKP